MERKLLITSAFVTLGAIAFLSGYLLMPEQDLGQQAGTLLNRFNNSVETGSPDNKTPDTAPLSSRKFLSFANPFTDSQKIVAVESTGNIVEIDTVTLNEKVVYTGLTGIVETVLSPAGDSLIYSFYDTGNNKKHVYLNFRKGGSAPIAGDVRSAAFSPRGDQSAYLVSKSQASGEIFIAKGANIIKQAIKTRLGAAGISWPSDFLSIVSYDKGGYGDLFILKEGGELNKILSYQYDLSAKWPPFGERVLFSTKDSPSYSGQTTINEHLFYKDVKNDKPLVSLDISANASKCVWLSKEEIICGVKNQAQIKDEFYKISLTDGSKTLVATPGINLFTKVLALNRAGNTLFVLNDIDGKLYALKLQE